jgi:hypothetical protein
MKLSSREMVLAWATGVCLLAAGSYLLAEPAVRDWKNVLSQKAETRHKIDMTRRLLDQGHRWNARLSELRKRLPTYPADKDVTADLGIRIDNIAKAHELAVTSRDMDKETTKGEMYELAANCKWEGKLDALVRFLFDLQNEDAMLDISQLTVTPNEKKVLRGSFTVYCSYSRQHPTGGSPPKPETKTQGQ